MPQSDSTRILLKLKALKSVAHGEAGANASGPNNTTLFNRGLVAVDAPEFNDVPEKIKVRAEAVLSSFPVGEASVDFLETLSGPELLAVLFTAQFPTIYSGDGEGLFSGTERYQYLTTRLTDGAAASVTLSELWAYASRKLGLTLPGDIHLKRLQSFFMLPRSVQSQILSVVMKQPPLVVMGARFVAESLKATNVNYAVASGKDFSERTTYAASERQIGDLLQSRAEKIYIRTPEISGNSLRHNILREAGASRLLGELGLVPHSRSERGAELFDVPNVVGVGVERFLYSGGNTAAKSSAPGNADVLEATARRNYPYIDAVGGAFDKFLMAEGMTEIAGWVICREHNQFTRAVAGIESRISIYDFVQDETRTRAGIGGRDAESGQMIFSYETLAAGVEVLLEIRFRSFCRPLVKGCVRLAVTDWLDDGGTLGARSATGHGSFAVEDWLTDVASFGPLAERYLEAVALNRDALRAGLLDKTFGTGVILCAA